MKPKRASMNWLNVIPDDVATMIWKLVWEDVLTEIRSFRMIYGEGEEWNEDMGPEEWDYYTNYP